MNTEDKVAWCGAAEVQERAFAVGRLFTLGLSGAINTAKRHDPFTHDLFVNFPADLKSVRTPLFKARELYGIDPQFAVTFNLKDGERYASQYPNIVVVFDVDWKETSKEIGGTVFSVDPMHVTYAGFLDDIRSAITADGGKRIDYSRRVDDTAGNAKSSWVFDIRRLHKLTDPDEKDSHQ